MRRAVTVLLLVFIIVVVLATLLTHLPFHSGAGSCKARIVVPVSAKMLVDEKGCGVGVLELVVEDNCAARVDSVSVEGLNAKPLSVREGVVVKGPKAYIVVYYNPYTRMLLFISTSRPWIEAENLLAKGLCIPGLNVGQNYVGSISVEGKEKFFVWVTMPAGG